MQNKHLPCQTETSSCSRTFLSVRRPLEKHPPTQTALLPHGHPVALTQLSGLWLVTVQTNKVIPGDDERNSWKGAGLLFKQASRLALPAHRMIQLRGSPLTFSSNARRSWKNLSATPGQYHGNHENNYSELFLESCVVSVIVVFVQNCILLLFFLDSEHFWRQLDGAVTVHPAVS